MEQSQIDKLAKILHEEFASAIKYWFRNTRSYEKRLRGQSFHGGIHFENRVTSQGQPERHAWVEVCSEDKGCPQQLKTICIHHATQEDDVPTLDEIMTLVERQWDDFMSGYSTYMKVLELHLRITPFG